MNGMNGNIPKMNDKSPSPDCGEEQKLLSPTMPTTPIILQVTKNRYSSFKSRSRYRAGPTRKLRRRAVLKNGDCNVLQSRISRRSLRFLQDIFTTLVDTQWRWTLLCFILSFFLSWLGFAVIWWLIAFTHGDFEESHLPPQQMESNWTPCVYNIFSFTSCFLFSIETQHTIGYGSRSTTEECPEAIFVMCIQSIAGVMIQAFMVGIVFAKMTRPKQRTQTLLFSRNAVICQRDGELCLMFRVGDMRKSHIIGVTVRAQMIRTRTTKEGEVLVQNQQELVVGTDGENSDLFFIWPTTIIHRINDASPFYNMSAEDMLTERFEVVLILEGTIESTGQTTQARSSYLPQEILWGHRFDPMVSYSKERQGYEVDYSLFDSTTQVDTPLCSGKELAEFYKIQDDLRHGTDGNLRRVPSEPKSAPVVFDALSRSFNNTGFHFIHQSVLNDRNHLAQRQCWCRPTNRQRLKLSLAPLSSPRTPNAEDDYWAENADRVQINSNCIQNSSDYISHGPQINYVDQMFNFDAIQVMEDTEFEQLPEAVNNEILKNSQKIIFEEGEVSRRNPIELYRQKDKIFRNSWEIRFEEEEDISMQRTAERDSNEEKKRIQKNKQEIVFKAEERCLEKHLITKLDQTNDSILKDNQEIVFEEKKDSSGRNFLGLTEEKDDSLQEQNRQEFAREEEERELLEKNVDMEQNDISKRSQEIPSEKEDILTFLKQKVLKRFPIRLDLKDNPEIYEEEEFPLVRVEENHRDVENNLQELRRKYETRNKELAREDYEMCFKRLGVCNQRCQIVPQHQYQKNTRKYLFLNEERKSLSGLNRSFSDNSFIINNRRSLKESRRNAISQLIVPINQDQKNLKKDFSLNEEPISKKFNNDLINDFSAVARRPVSEFGRDAISKQAYKICNEEELEAYKSVHFQNKEQKLLKESNMNTIDDIFMINDRKSFRESRRNAINNVKNIRVLEEGRKSSERSTKYLSIALDNSSDNSTSWQRSNYFNFSTRENGNDQIERHNDIKFENEKMPKRSSSDHLIKVATQNKFRPSDYHLSINPILDLSPESGFCEESLFDLNAECRGTKPRSIARNRSRDVDEVKGNNSW